MAANWKGITTATQVNVRELPDSNSASKGRLNKDSEIEIGTTTITDRQGNIWREVAYAYQIHGYISTDYISITDRTAKYYMWECLNAFEDTIWQRGHSDLHGSYGPIHNIQTAINAVNRKFYYDGQLDLEVDGVFGSNTETSVKAFQKFAGCSVDGKVGPHTKARLYFIAYNRGGWPLAEKAD